MTILDRIDELISKVETDQPIDWRKTALLIDLEAVRLGEQAQTEAMEREKEADGRLEEFLAGN